MLRYVPTHINCILTVVFVLIWHCSTMYICRRMSPDNFDYRLRHFAARKWERNGKWYNDRLKINKWKDLLPQFVSKGGFSKERIDSNNISIEYLDTFIMETCRGEWDHGMNCVCVIPVIIINPTFWGILASFLILIGNLPFYAIQRYNRFRLLTLRKKFLRDKKRQESTTDKLSDESDNCEQIISIVEG